MKKLILLLLICSQCQAFDLPQMARLYLAWPEFNLRYFAENVAPYYTRSPFPYQYKQGTWALPEQTITSRDRIVSETSTYKWQQGGWLRASTRIIEETNITYDTTISRRKWYVPLVAAAEPNVIPVQPTIIDPNSIEDPVLRSIVEKLLTK